MRFVFALFTILSLAGCLSSGDSDNSSDDPVAVPAGIYYGTTTLEGESPDNAMATILSDGRMLFINFDTNMYFYGNTNYYGTFGGSERFLPEYTLPTSYGVGGRFNSISGDTIFGEYTLTVYDESYSFELTANTELYDRGWDLSRLEGVWVDNTDVDTTLGTTTWTISSTGDVALDSTSGCTGTGQFTPVGDGSVSKNEYNFSFDTDGAACGTYARTTDSPAVLVDTYFTNDTLIFNFNPLSSPGYAGLIMAIKQ